MLEQARRDVLILLDCCAAASSIAGSGSGITEVIAACGFNNWAPSPGEHSFTRSLIEELKFMARRRPCSTALLHSRILTRLKHWDPNFSVPVASERRTTPVHILLNNERNQHSIELRPQRTQNVTVEGPSNVSFSGSHSSAPSTDEIEDIEMSMSEDSSSQSSLCEVWPDPLFKCPRVLISVALQEDQVLSTGDWAGWLRSVPALANYAPVEGVYRSYSTLLILSLSIALCDMLPKQGALAFIGFATSPNMLLPGATKNSRVHSDGLAEKPSADLEIPPAQTQKQPYKARNLRMVCDACRMRKIMALPTYLLSRSKC